MQSLDLGMRCCVGPAGERGAIWLPAEARPSRNEKLISRCLGRLTHSPFPIGRGEQQERASAKPRLAKSPAGTGSGKAPARANAAWAVLWMLPRGLCLDFQVLLQPKSEGERGSDHREDAWAWGPPAQDPTWRRTRAVAALS